MIKFFYSRDWLDSKRDWPKPGTICVHPDSQNRLGKNTWTVSVFDDGTFGGDLTQLGLFWRLDEAIRYAESIECNEPYPTFLIERYKRPSNGFDSRCELNGCIAGSNKNYCRMNLGQCKYSDYPGKKSISRYSDSIRILNAPDLSFADLVVKPAGEET